MRLENRVAIITGVSHAGQVGFALASAFAREGAKLAIASRSEERVKARANELQAQGANVIGIPADLTSEEGARHLVQETVSRFGRIDILVNLAGGLTKYGPTHELSLAAWESELNNNLRSTFLCSREVSPVMKQQGGGAILNFSTAGGVQGASPMMLAYNCAKAGVDALTRTLAKEWKNDGIRVNSLGPGLIVTQSNLESMKPSREDLEKKWVSKEQIIEAALFLVSSAGDGVTGAILPVQGRGV
ncbi:MAG TPA: SDR family NAD(P)-dependent oxidoreductase [Ktedonobacteraceae bacterium]|nr:SDR family NAD(P)-dependent oxidoreductase [Ktedonobacteraceae bacterium]